MRNISDSHTVPVPQCRITLNQAAIPYILLKPLIFAFSSPLNLLCVFTPFPFFIRSAPHQIYLSSVFFSHSVSFIWYCFFLCVSLCEGSFEIIVCALLCLHLYLFIFLVFYSFFFFFVHSFYRFHSDSLFVIHIFDGFSHSKQYTLTSTYRRSFRATKQSLPLSMSFYRTSNFHMIYNIIFAFSYFLCCCFFITLHLFRLSERVSGYTFIMSKYKFLVHVDAGEFM